MAALYRRVSTDQQDASLETQETRVNTYVELRGFTATDQTTFADEDTSGSIPLLERPGGARLFATLKHCPQIKHVVVAKLDRLGRSARDLLETVHKLDQMGVTLHIVDMGGDSLSSNGAAGRLMFTILAGMAEFERELIRGRIQDALDRRFDQHRLIGTVPYGFNFDPDHNPNLTPNPAQQAVIRRIAHLRDEVKCSFKQIADELNRDGIPTKVPKGTRIKLRNARGSEPEVWGEASGRWNCGNVAGVLNSKHTARLLAESASIQAAA